MTSHSAPQQRRLLVLDDDPTGSQCVAEVEVAFTEDPTVPAEVLREDGAVCFVLTNTRALTEDDAVAKNRRIIRGVLEAGTEVRGLHVVSRSDSTLRGHVIAEPNVIADELADYGVQVDAFLFCPAMIEAGRFTERDRHYAVVDGDARLVEDTDFARDATFGYSTSHLPSFLAERSGGKVCAADVLSVTLEDIRVGGAERVVQVLREARERTWVVINATEYRDMQVVVEAVGYLEQEGHVFVSRCGPSFVRPLAGQQEARVLTADDIRSAAAQTSGTGEETTGQSAHGLVVVGSHVGLTTQQLQVVQERGGLQEIEISVPALLEEATREQEISRAADAVINGLAGQDVVLYTSRELVSTDSEEESLQIARAVSDAVVEVVQRVRSARPAWVVAKGGITSHEVAAHGLGIARARVQGQFWAGQISLFVPRQAPQEVVGCPYVVFPGNVGGREALADVISRMHEAAR